MSVLTTQGSVRHIIIKIKCLINYTDTKVDIEYQSISEWNQGLFCYCKGFIYRLNKKSFCVLYFLLRNLFCLFVVVNLTIVENVDSVH